MSVVSKPYTFSAGATIIASEHNSNFDTIYNDYNGSITNANIAANAAIADTKLASITTAGKVNLTALSITSQATGDIVYASAANTLARLAGNATTTKKFLSQTGNGSISAAPQWDVLSSSDLPAGAVVQVINSQFSAVASGTETIPYDGTIPQNTEGKEYMTCAITPKSATNKLKIDVVFVGEGTDTQKLTAALFQDTTANALAANSIYFQASNITHTISFTYYMDAGTTSETTFKVRAGVSSSGTTTFNGYGGTNQIFGNSIKSSLTITEIKV